MSFNKIFLYGNLGRDPELRYTPQGTPVCNFSLATSEKTKDGEVTTWFRITTWGKQAETASQYLKKGSSVFIEGSLKLSEWEKDGKTHTTLEVNARDMHFTGGSRQEADSSQKEEKPPLPSHDDIDDNDIPF